VTIGIVEGKAEEGEEEEDDESDGEEAGEPAEDDFGAEQLVGPVG
jgi:hypothetical protein